MKARCFDMTHSHSNRQTDVPSSRRSLISSPQESHYYGDLKGHFVMTGGDFNPGAAPGRRAAGSLDATPGLGS